LKMLNRMMLKLMGGGRGKIALLGWRKRRRRLKVERRLLSHSWRSLLVENLLLLLLVVERKTGRTGGHHWHVVLRRLSHHRRILERVLLKVLVVEHRRVELMLRRVRSSRNEMRKALGIGLHVLLLLCWVDELLAHWVCAHRCGLEDHLLTLRLIGGVGWRSSEVLLLVDVRRRVELLEALRRRSLLRLLLLTGRERRGRRSAILLVVHLQRRVDDLRTRLEEGRGE